MCSTFPRLPFGKCRKHFRFVLTPERKITCVVKGANPSRKKSKRETQCICQPDRATLCIIVHNAIGQKSATSHCTINTYIVKSASEKMICILHNGRLSPCHTPT